MRRVLAVTVALLALAAVPASASAASPKRAAVRLVGRVEAVGTALDRAAAAPGKAYEQHLAGCAVTDDQAPDAAMVRVASVWISLTERNLFSGLGPALDRADRRLNAVHSADPALDRLGPATATVLRLLRVLGPVEPCGYYAAWKAAGWDPAFRLDPAPRNWTPEEHAALRAAERDIARAVTRLWAIGVPRGTVRRLPLTGVERTLFVDLDL